MKMTARRSASRTSSPPSPHPHRMQRSQPSAAAGASPSSGSYRHCQAYLTEAEAAMRRTHQLQARMQPSPSSRLPPRAGNQQRRPTTAPHRRHHHPPRQGIALARRTTRNTRSLAVGRKPRSANGWQAASIASLSPTAARRARRDSTRRTCRSCSRGSRMSPSAPSLLAPSKRKSSEGFSFPYPDSPASPSSCCLLLFPRSLASPPSN